MKKEALTAEYKLAFNNFFQITDGGDYICNDLTVAGDEALISRYRRNALLSGENNEIIAIDMQTGAQRVVVKSQEPVTSFCCLPEKRQLYYAAGLEKPVLFVANTANGESTPCFRFDSPGKTLINGLKRFGDKLFAVNFTTHWFGIFDLNGQLLQGVQMPEGFDFPFDITFEDDHTLLIISWNKDKYFPAKYGQYRRTEAATPPLFLRYDFTQNTFLYPETDLNVEQDFARQITKMEDRYYMLTKNYFYKLKYDQAFKMVYRIGLRELVEKSSGHGQPGGSPENTVYAGPIEVGGMYIADNKLFLLENLHRQGLCVYNI